jgi:hypothetical protein
MKKVRKYADGGKANEYGKPTFARAVAARVGVGDGYGNPKPAAPKRMNVANAATTMGDVLAKRKKALNEYADGGKVKKRKGC